jgi:hypothetical protein
MRPDPRIVLNLVVSRGDLVDVYTAVLLERPERDTLCIAGGWVFSNIYCTIVKTNSATFLLYISASIALL